MALQIRLYEARARLRFQRLLCSLNKYTTNKSHQINPDLFIFGRTKPTHANTYKPIQTHTNTYAGSQNNRCSNRRHNEIEIERERESENYRIK